MHGARGRVGCSAAIENDVAKKTKSKPRLPAPLVYGELPTEQINAALGLELDPGEVVMSGRAQLHAAKNHPDDYSRLQPHVASVLRAPLYAGDDFKNEGKIELIGRIPSLNENVLVAVQVEKDHAGKYNVVSFYPVSEEKITNRRLKGRLSIIR